MAHRRVYVLVRDKHWNCLIGVKNYYGLRKNVHKINNNIYDHYFACHQGGQYALPGGRQEDNETAIEAARRELHEETGLCVKKKKLNILIEKEEYIVYEYVIKKFSAKLNEIIKKRDHEFARFEIISVELIKKRLGCFKKDVSYNEACKLFQTNYNNENENESKINNNENNQKWKKLPKKIKQLIITTRCLKPWYLRIDWYQYIANVIYCKWKGIQHQNVDLNIKRNSNINYKLLDNIICNTEIFKDLENKMNERDNYYHVNNNDNNNNNDHHYNGYSQHDYDHYDRNYDIVYRFDNDDNYHCKSRSHTHLQRSLNCKKFH